MATKYPSARFTEREALQFHSQGKPGKLEITPTKPLTTQRDLSLAYSPGVAVPVLAIARDPQLAYDYTNKGNLVAVISNGTAVLGLGNLGAHAAKPVMEGKGALFKRFADIDAIDILIDSPDPEAVINCVRYLGPSFGGINLEDIKAPDCFIIEEKLKELLDIPVFHDDQHGTAIIAAAGLINALELTGRDMANFRLVVNGAGAAGIACLDLLLAMGMAPNPIIFAMANPDPEITPEDVAAVRADAIVATGRSDYPNQINNVLGFPFIFRGALDVQASTINQAMKIAAAKALAKLAREDVPDQVAAAFLGRQVRYGPDYIIPAPFDPRLITHVPLAVAKAAMDSGVARRPIVDMERYGAQLSARLDPVAGWLHSIFAQVRHAPRRIVFAEGEQPQVARAANAFYNAGLGRPILIGRGAPIREAFDAAGIDLTDVIEMHDTSLDERRQEYAEFLFARLQRKGYLLRDCQRLVNNDRNVFAACMVALGHADGMVTGVTRNWYTAYEDVRRVLDARPRRRVIGVSIALNRGRAVLVADVSVHDMPNAEQLADIAEEAVRVARRLAMEPRVAFLAYSTFGHPRGERSDQVREAVSLLDKRQVDFEYDGDMSADVALNREIMKQYPFCRLSDSANVLIMPAFHSASISTKMLRELGGATLIGPMLVGLTHSVQICPLGAKDSDVVNMAALAAYDVNG